MRKDKISFIKTNLISFTVVGLICVGIGVYAAVTFPSNEVFYDNSSSGLKSTNVKGAIDELYKECTQTAADKVIEDGQLEKDPYECRYFFTGANPNNYITFIGPIADWRIISVECDGTIKIMSTSDMKNQVWDTYRINDWANASLNTYLNGKYLNGLDSTAQSQIVSHDWGIGAVTELNNDLGGQVNDENSKKWNGKVALATVSEYIRTNSNTNCNTYRKFSYNYSTCRKSTWMFNGMDWWTLSPYNGDSHYVNIVDTSGTIGEHFADDKRIGVHVVVYLSSNLKLSGSGTQSDPYTIK